MCSDYTLNAVVMVFKLMGYSVHPSFDLGPEFYEFMVKIRDLSYNGRRDFVLGSRFAVGQKLHLADIDVLRRYHADKVLLLSAGSAVVVSQVYRVRYSYIFTSGDLDDCVRYSFFIGNTPFFVPMHYFKECPEFSIKNNYGEECKDASGLQ